jgi:uncharacterized protein (DUF433 family)
MMKQLSHRDPLGDSDSMTVASIEHIELDNSGTARIVGQRTKVVQIVMDKMANGWSPEEIQGQYPHLSLAQIHAALA